MTRTTRLLDSRGLAARALSLLGLVLGLVLGATTLGCHAAPAPRTSVTLVVVGARAKEVEDHAARADVGVDLRVAHAPGAQAAAPPAGRMRATDVESALATARADYASGELARVRSCAERLGDPELVWSTLGRRARTVAARVLVWRIACASIVRRDEATAAAQTFAALGLELPSDVDSIPVEAHKILTAALGAAERAPRGHVGVRSVPGDAAVLVDGRAACTTPCDLDLGAGDHHVAVEKSGFQPASRVVKVEAAGAPASASFALDRASPELAAAQWAAAYGTHPARADDGEALSLLGTALRARKLVYLDVESLGSAARIRGALVSGEGGRVEARDEQRGPVPSATDDVLRELLVKGGIVESGSLARKPLFWVIVAGAVAASVGVTAYALHDPGTRTEVRTR